MNDKEKLVELIKTARTKEKIDHLFDKTLPSGDEYLANYLIANGVTVQERLEEKQATSDKTSEWIPAKDTNVLTNADRIRSMSDEELAESLEDWQDWGGGLTKELWLKWLKELVEVDG